MVVSYSVNFIVAKMATRTFQGPEVVFRHDSASHLLRFLLYSLLVRLDARSVPLKLPGAGSWLGATSKAT